MPSAFFSSPSLLLLALALLAAPPSAVARGVRCTEEEIDAYALRTPMREGEVLEVDLREEGAAGRFSGQHFFEHHVQRNAPVVLRGAVDMWPAVANWDDAYLAHVAGDEDVFAEVSPDATFGYEPENEEVRLTLRQFLAKYEEKGRATEYYIGDDVPDKLQATGDYWLPSFIPCHGEEHYYTEDGWWFGAGGQRSVLHADPDDNVLMMIDGRKTVYLFEPEHGAAFGLRMPRDEAEAEDPQRDNATPLLSDVDVDAPDYDAFPGLADVAGHRVVLHPGDALYIPKFWLHQVFSQCRNIAIFHWFDIHNVRGELVRRPELFSWTAAELVRYAIERHGSRAPCASIRGASHDSEDL